MSHHVAPKRRADRTASRRPAPKRRAAVPRRGRIAVASLASMITVVALLGAVGVLPGRQGDTAAYAGNQALTEASSHVIDSAAILRQAKAYADSLGTERQLALKQASTSTAMPVESGKGRRAVFDMSAQRVWIVSENGKVQRTYLASGSVLDNLEPGTYRVYSRSRHAVGIDESGVMEYFVRFTQGENAAIGFHSIPTLDGKPLQTRAQLGTPLSHGCIRQARPNALAMWDFAQLGTKVVVTA